MDNLKSKQFLLEKFAVVGVNNTYWFEGMVIDTGFGYFKLRQLCLEMQDEGYLSVTKTEASLTQKGYIFYHSGGYFPVTQYMIINEKHIPSKNAAIAKVISLWKILSANPIAKWIFGILTVLLCAYIIFRFKWN